MDRNGEEVRLKDLAPDDQAALLKHSLA